MFSSLNVLFMEATENLLQLGCILCPASLIVLMNKYVVYHSFTWKCCSWSFSSSYSSSSSTTSYTSHRLITSILNQPSMHQCALKWLIFYTNCFYTNIHTLWSVWMVAGLSKLSWTKSDWLDSGAGWGYSRRWDTPLSDQCAQIKPANTPGRSPAWQRGSPASSCDGPLAVFVCCCGIAQLLCLLLPVSLSSQVGGAAQSAGGR